MEVNDGAAPASALRLVHLLSAGSGSERAQAFQRGFELVSPGEILLVDGAGLLEDRAAREPPIFGSGACPVVLLDADRWEVTELCERFPIAAAIEKYALFAWWKNHEKAPPGAYWIHGETRIALGLGPDVVASPLHRSEAHCAFGSTSAAGLPALLARYVDAWVRDRASG